MDNLTTTLLGNIKLSEEATVEKQNKKREVQQQVDALSTKIANTKNEVEQISKLIPDIRQKLQAKKAINDHAVLSLKNLQRQEASLDARIKEQQSLQIEMMTSISEEVDHVCKSANLFMKKFGINADEIMINQRDYDLKGKCVSELEAAEMLYIEINLIEDAIRNREVEAKALEEIKADHKVLKDANDAMKIQGNNLIETAHQLNIQKNELNNSDLALRVRQLQVEVSQVMQDMNNTKLTNVEEELIEHMQCQDEEADWVDGDFSSTDEHS